MTSQDKNVKVILQNSEIHSVPTKKNLSDWIRKIYICCWQNTNLKCDGIDRLKVKGWEMIYHANTIFFFFKAGLAMFRLD